MFLRKKPPLKQSLLMVEPQLKSLPNMHKSLRFIFVLAQVFGYFPVQGVMDNDTRKIGFTWISLRVASSILTAMVGIIVTLGHIRHILFIDGYQQHQMNAVVFYTSGTLSCILFIKLADKWHEIMEKWTILDKTMISYGWPKKLDRNLRNISIIFLTLEAAEHFSIQANKLIVAVGCRDSFAKGFEHYAVNMSFSMIFDTISYAAWIAIIFQSMNTRMAFSWTFIDLFIILMSLAISARFMQINAKIRHLKEMKVTTVKSWGLVCDDYNRLCKFCDYLDDKISWLILVSFANNVYFIIFHIFASLTLVMATDGEIVYYFISLGLLLMRIVTICLYASKVHEQSKVSMDVLVATSDDVYNKEIMRLIESIKYQTIGITGKKMFLITKSLILKITSAVVAYELVVIQFKKNIPQKEGPSLYSMC